MYFLQNGRSLPFTKSRYLYRHSLISWWGRKKLIKPYKIGPIVSPCYYAVCYLVTLNGAKKLINEMKTINIPIDHIINDPRRAHNLYGILPFPIAHNTKLPSSLDKDRKHLVQLFSKNTKANWQLDHKPKERVYDRLYKVLSSIQKPPQKRLLYKTTYLLQKQLPTAYLMTLKIIYWPLKIIYWGTYIPIRRSVMKLSYYMKLSYQFISYYLYYLSPLLPPKIK